MQYLVSFEQIHCGKNAAMDKMALYITKRNAWFFKEDHQEGAASKQQH